jgi:hypothetical protein
MIVLVMIVLGYASCEYKVKFINLEDSKPVDGNFDGNLQTHFKTFILADKNPEHYVAHGTPDLWTDITPKVSTAGTGNYSKPYFYTSFPLKDNFGTALSYSEIDDGSDDDCLETRNGYIRIYEMQKDQEYMTTSSRKWALFNELQLKTLTYRGQYHIAKSCTNELVEVRVN